jgi:hypothetical protein
MFMFSFYLGQPRLVEVDLDGFAAEVGAIVLEGESTFLNKGTFGLLCVVVVRYLGWPLLKPGLRKLWGWLIGKCCNAPLKPSPQKLLLEQVTQINKSLKVVVERGAPVPAPAVAASNLLKKSVMMRGKKNLDRKRGSEHHISWGACKSRS